MRSFRYRSNDFFIAGLLLVVLFSANSCKDTDTANSNVNSGAAQSKNDQKNSVKDDIDELATIIRLPETPEEAVWREDAAGNSDAPNAGGRHLTAVLKYNSENAAKIVASAEKNKSAEPVEIGTEDWFPEELTAQTQISGSESLKAFSYAANDFFNPPFTTGRISRIEQTNYFVLELSTF